MNKKRRRKLPQILNELEQEAILNILNGKTIEMNHTNSIIINPKSADDIRTLLSHVTEKSSKTKTKEQDVACLGHYTVNLYLI